MIIDTHNHVGLAPLAQSLEVLAQKASAMGVVCGVITAGGVEDFERVRQTAQKLNWGYCVGLHPLYIRENWQADIKALSAFLETHQDDPHLVGIGEIGLDFYVEGLDRDRQEAVFKEELQLALRFNLPVSLHSRRALYRVLALMKEYPTVSGVLHAFAGSLDEMKQAVRRGLYLGMGGAMTFPGSKRVRTAAIQARSVLSFWRPMLRICRPFFQKRRNHLLWICRVISLSWPIFVKRMKVFYPRPFS